MLSEWKEKVALVTGGTRGIGRAIVTELAKLGATVVLTGRDSEVARSAENEISGSVLGLPMDVCERTTVDNTVKQVLEAYGRIDILVNNAGITKDGLFLRMSKDDWDSVIATNLSGLYNCSQAVLRTMIRQRSGRIINISSVVGLMGNAGQANYASSKAAVLGFTKALAREVASRNITVNAVAPGYVNTDMTKELTAEATSKLLENIPLQRIGQPEEVAAAVLYLASDDANYVTGQILHVNGGLYM